ncbi:MAG: prephenate dehydrogenase [Cyclobacteriaceae bacterium]
MKISIIGLGLIGGSYALSLKKRFEDIEIYGWDENKGHLNRALDLGLIDHACDSTSDALQKGDWNFLAVPVNTIEVLLPDLLDQLEENNVLIDFGSTKKLICVAVKDHPKRSQFIAAHPISGTEYSGPDAAFDSLFEDKVMIVCEQEKSSPSFIEGFRKQCKALGMSTTYLTAEEHDIHLAYVSHLSHVISFGLSRTVLDKEEDENKILDLAGSGFESTVRLAKSSPEMWTPIFLKNREAILESLGKYQNRIAEFRELLANEDESGIQNYLKEGRTIRKILA